MMRSTSRVIAISSLARRLHLALLAALLIAGICWLFANAPYVPGYGDTSEYLDLSRTLHVDQYRTIFYPAVLRMCGIFRAGSSTPTTTWIYLLQCAAALISSAILASALLRVFATPGQSPRMRAAIVSITAALVATNPLVAHFSLSIMTDSLAASLTIAAIGSLAHLLEPGPASVRRRLSWAGVSFLCLLLMASSRVDKLYTAAVLGIAAAVCLRAAIRREQGRVDGKFLLGVVLMVAAAIGLAGAFNRATQTWSTFRPPLNLSTMAFNRVVWPRFARVYPYLSTRAKLLATLDEARHFDVHNNNVYPFLAKTLIGHPENAALIDEITVTTLKMFPLQVAGNTAFDVVKYALPNEAFPLELFRVLPRSTGTDWTYTRMNAPHPAFTDAWLLLSTCGFFLVQLPAALCFLRRRRVRVWVRSPVIVLGLTATAFNAMLFGLEAGMAAHIRYALPTYMLFLETVVVLSLLWLFDAGRETQEQA